ncbi:MAG: YraN family protein [Thermodesulfovibrionales bacterium]
MMRSLGADGEELAARYLRERGCAVLHRNYRTPVGEADIVVLDRETVVFVEVKARSSSAFGQPFEAVDFRKQEKLRRVALYYLKQQGVESPVRFDVISVLFRDGRGEITHIKEAF